MWHKLQSSGRKLKLIQRYSDTDPVLTFLYLLFLALACSCSFLLACLLAVLSYALTYFLTSLVPPLVTCFTLLDFTWLYFTLPCLALPDPYPYPTLTFTFTFIFTLAPCLTLPYLALPCLALPYLALPCLTYVCTPSLPLPPSLSLSLRVCHVLF